MRAALRSSNRRKGRHMRDKLKAGTLKIAVISAAVIVLLLVLSTVWSGISAHRSTERAVHTVSNFYLGELAGRREQVVASNLFSNIQNMNNALELLDGNDLSDIEHLQAFQARMKKLRRLINAKPIVRIMESHCGLTGLIIENLSIEKDGENRQFDGMWSSSLTDSTSKGKPDIEAVDLTRYTAMQLNVNVPAGSSIRDIRLAGSNGSSHKLAYQQTGNGQYTVVVYSMGNQTFKPVNGCLLEVITDGDGEPVTANVLLATPTGERTFIGTLPNGLVTGISSVYSGQMATANVYDLRGNKVLDKGMSTLRLPKGIYIMNGKRIIK